MGKLTDDQLRFIIDLDASGAQGEANTLSASIHKLEQANKEYAASNRETQKEIAKMEKELSKLSKAGEVGTDKYNKLTKSIRESKQNIEENERTMRKNNATIAENRKKIGELTSGLKLSDMTMGQLRQRASQLRKELDMTSKSASPDMYRKLQRELEATTNQMEKLGKKTNALTTLIKGNLASNALSTFARWAFDELKKGTSTFSNQQK